MEKEKEKEHAKAREHVLREDEIERVKSACKEKEEKLTIYTILYTGMRKGEFLHLRDSWINWNSEKILIPETQVCNCSKCRREKDGVWKTKTEASKRGVPMVDEVKPILKEYFSDHNKILETINNGVKVWRICKRIGNRIDINHKVFPHGLRATYASILAKKGFTASSICYIMGWSSISIGRFYVRRYGSEIDKEYEKKW